MDLLCQMEKLYLRDKNQDYLIKNEINVFMWWKKMIIYMLVLIMGFDN